LLLTEALLAALLQGLGERYLDASMIAIWAHNCRAVMQPLGAGVAAGSLTRVTRVGMCAQCRLFA
jgi:hypothetical protein